MYNVYVDDNCLQAIVFWGSSCFAVRRSDCPVFLSGTFYVLFVLASPDEQHGEGEEEHGEDETAADEE